MKSRLHRRRLDDKLMCDLCCINHSTIYLLQQGLSSKLTRNCNLGRWGEMRGAGRSKEVKEKLLLPDIARNEK
jgi:hypothetical protein